MGPEHDLGPRIRSRRLQLGLTLSDLGRKCGLSASSLSKAENGRTRLSHRSLAKLGGGLGVNVSDFLADQSGTGGRRSVTRRGRGKKFILPGYRLTYLAADILRKRLVPMVLTIKARTIEEAGGLRYHEGEEVYYVLRGIAQLLTDTYAPLTMRPGDCVFMDGMMGHAFISVEKECAQVLSVNEGYPVYSAATGELAIDSGEMILGTTPVDRQRRRTHRTVHVEHRVNLKRNLRR